MLKYLCNIATGHNFELPLAIKLTAYSFTISKMESKIGFIFKSVYVMLIPNRLFIYLFNILCKDFFSVKRMFSSIWLIWRVVAITFSHRKQCLIATSFDIVPSAPLHLNQIFCFYLYLNIKKAILLVNSNNLYKLQTLF